MYAATARYSTRAARSPQQQILDGELLLLRPFAESLPPAVFDDVSDAVASAVKPRPHAAGATTSCAVAGLAAGVLLLVLMASSLWFADPLGHDMHRLPGIIAGVVRPRC